MQVIKSKSKQTFFTSSRGGNIFMVNHNKILSNDACLLIKEDESCLCNMRVAHTHMDHPNNLICKDIVIGL